MLRGGMALRHVVPSRSMLSSAETRALIVEKARDVCAQGACDVCEFISFANQRCSQSSRDVLHA